MQIFKTVGKSLLVAGAIIMLAAPVMAVENETGSVNGSGWGGRIQIFDLNADQDQDKTQDQTQDQDKTQDQTQDQDRDCVTD